MKAVVHHVRLSPHLVPNVGSHDRFARLGLASVLLGLTLSGAEPPGVGALMALLSIPLVITALMAWDPLYALLGIRTATLRVNQGKDWHRRDQSDELLSVNIGSADRLGRLALSTALFSLAIVGSADLVWTTVAAIAATIIVATVVTGWDPLYHLLKIRTATLSTKRAPAVRLDQSTESFPLYDEEDEKEVAPTQGKAA